MRRTDPESARPVPPAPPARRVVGVAVEAVDLRAAGDRRRFIEVPRRLHGEDANFVSPVIRDQMWFLDPDRNPTLEELDVQGFLAHRAGRTFGWVVAFVGRDAPDCGGFGLFDCADDPGAAGALLDAARRWLRRRGARHMVGPVDFRLAHGGGVLVQGFLRPPVVGAAYNPPYTAALLEASGLTPARDLLSWRWCLAGDADRASAARLMDHAERARARSDVFVRPADMRRLEDELADWHALYNAALRDRSDRLPVSRRVFDAIAYDLSRLALDDLVLVAEVRGRPVGLAVTVPDINPLLPASGRLFPLAWIRLHRCRSTVRQARLRWLSVHPDFRMQGIETVLLAETARAARALGLEAIDVCWTGEDDHTLNHEIRRVGARLDRRYRLYEGALDGD
jgi:GNAT superfamily N-acetyltransferase